MKIGILTYHRSYNYGALLQAVATRFILEKMGHHVLFIDYWPSYHRRMYALFDIRNITNFHIRSNLKYFIKSIFLYNKRKKLYKKFNDFISTYITPNTTSLNDKFDIVVYGSDQIWRKQPYIGIYNPIYFGQNKISTKKHVAFAASMGQLPQTDGDCKQIVNLVQNIDCLSVREHDLAKFLRSYGFNPQVVLDPTLLLSFDQWNNLVPTPTYTGKKYVLLFEIALNSFNINEIKSFAAKKNLELKILYNDTIQRDNVVKTIWGGPFEFLQLIKNAEYVFTSSFHGMVFSIMYRKNFFASFSHNASRAQSLLCYLGIEKRLLTPQSAIPCEDQVIDYTSVLQKLNIQQKNTLNFLRESLT